MPSEDKDKKTPALMVKPEHIGQVLTVQYFQRNQNEPGSIDTDSMVKLVGTLQGFRYSARTKIVQIVFTGCPMESINLGTHHLEVFVA